MKIKSLVLALLTVLIMFVGIGATMLAGIWQSESSKMPAKYVAGEFAGQSNPADIRGSYSFNDIAAAFPVPVDVLVGAFGFDQYDNPAALQIKMFEDIYGEMDGLEIGTDSMRLFVALYLSLPYVPEEGTGLPYQAIGLLQQAGVLDAEAATELRNKYGVQLKAAEGVPEASDEPAAAAYEVKGQTTFGELLDWGLGRDEIAEVIMMEPGASGQSLRDFFLGKGLEFSAYKAKLQALLDERQGQ